MSLHLNILVYKYAYTLLFCLFQYIDSMSYRYIRLYILDLIDMGMKYRDRHEIAAQILEIANGNGVRLSKILYEGYLSHTVTKEYLELLIENGLIEYVDGERAFKTT